MMRVLIEKNWKCFLATATALFSYTVFLFSSKIYVYTDNITVSVVLNGLYGDNNYCQYVHPFLCVLIKMILPLLPYADVFTVLCHILIFVEIIILSYIGLDCISGRDKQQTYITFLAIITIIIGILFLFTAVNLWNINYSVQAASFVFTGMLMLFIGNHADKGVKWIITGTFYISMGFMLRLGAACLFIPYIGLAFISDIINSCNTKDEIIKLIKYISPAFICICMILLSRKVFYSIEPYESAQKYNTYRTMIEDYPFKTYGAYSSDYTGLEKTEYECARAWVLFDTENLNADKLKKIADVGRSKKGYNSFLLLSKAVWKTLVYTDLQLILLAIVTCILLIRNLVVCNNVWLKLESALAMLGTAIIMYYITWSGRSLLRVWQSVLFAAIAVLIIGCVCVSDSKTNVRHNNQINTATMFCLIVVFWFGLGQYIANSKVHAPYTALTARVDADDSVYSDTFKDNSIYLWPNWYATIPDYFSSIDKLPTKRVIEHNIPVGDWVYGQVYFNNYLHSIGADNPARSLFDRPDTYLMSDTAMIIDYLRVHFKSDLELTEVGEIRGEKAYRIR